MKAIILAGGRGTRLPESAKDIPKALVEVNSKFVIDHQLELLERHGVKEVVFALGFRNEQLINHINGKYEYVVESVPLGTGGAIKFASQKLNEPFLALNGDILSDIDFSDFISHFKQQENIVGSMTLVWMENAKDYGLVLHDDHKIHTFTEKPEEPTAGHINAGCYILTPGIFKEIDRESFSIEKEIFPKLASQKSLSAYIHNGKWIDMGTEERLKLARTRIWES